MPMSIGDACAVQTLIEWLITESDAATARGRSITLDEAQRAAVQLANRSRNVLHAGISGADVVNRWRVQPPRFAAYVPEP